MTFNLKDRNFILKLGVNFMLLMVSSPKLVRHIFHVLKQFFMLVFQNCMFCVIFTFAELVYIF